MAIIKYDFFVSILNPFPFQEKNLVLTFWTGMFMFLPDHPPLSKTRPSDGGAEMALQGRLQLLKLTWIDEAVEGLLTPETMPGGKCDQKWGNTPFEGDLRYKGSQQNG